mgnify:CR=1 FL=1
MFLSIKQNSDIKTLSMATLHLHSNYKMCTHYLFHVKNKSFHAPCSKARYAPVIDRSTLMTSLDPDTLG